MSNADISAEPRLLGKLAKSAVIERGGEKLGLIGLTPVDTTDLASPGDNISFTDPVAAVQREVDELTAKGVNKIIVLSHSGYGVDQRVAADTTGVDVIVGGIPIRFYPISLIAPKGPIQRWLAIPRSYLPMLMENFWEN
jgi:5'-nucleotidase